MDIALEENNLINNIMKNIIKRLGFNLDSMFGGEATAKEKKTREDLLFEWKVKSFAMDKHHKQLDDEGKDYFEAHLQNVADILTAANAERETILAGYLHDTLEDTKTTYTELVSKFGLKIAGLVHEVTHEGKKDSIGYYFPRLHSEQGIILKFADNLSNLNRMGCWTDERKKHHLKLSKFWKAFVGDKWQPKIIIPKK